MDFIISAVFNLLYILLIGRMILSFIPFTTLSMYHPIRRTVYDLTEPIMAPVRRILPPMGGLDFSPLIVLLVAGLLRNVLLSLF